ncbi:HIT family protein [Ignicoccus hospitalis]|uniref:Histidine triad (HIT) protein n=1 Tax=Ignicoccus hospitalis (strain KIN4/I / DSM 18386 / JCM 14125) TaxID=453591 RepID=A8ACC8_IGNH4|nr:HIT domain-containing protein [Ignicoccus hospitalis]ABU82580.1 histidine triad (HIT) protein [Ignicoccus hospitalis KIN4/I]
MFDVLWTPWRMQYVEKAGKEEGKCVFCELPNMDDEEALILYRGKYNYVVLNAFPYNTGHLMIVPYRHVSDVTEMDDAEILEMVKLFKRSVEVLRREYRPEGINAGWNLGRAAGAGIPGHLHLHVVPRWCGDANFMTIISRTKVLPEALNETWRRLRKGFEELGS